MRLLVSVFFLATLLATPVRAVELRIICPGIVYNAALGELVEDYNTRWGGDIRRIYEEYSY